MASTGNRPEMTEVINNPEAPPPPDPLAAPNFTAAAQPSYAGTLFLGPDGLRPGWGFLFYTLGFYALQRCANRLAWAHDFGTHGLWSTLLQELGDFVSAVLPALRLAKIERRPFGAYALPPREAFGNLFWVGAAWGYVSISVLLG